LLESGFAGLDRKIAGYCPLLYKVCIGEEVKVKVKVHDVCWIRLLLPVKETFLHGLAACAKDMADKLDTKAREQISLLTMINSNFKF